MKKNIVLCSAFIAAAALVLAVAEENKPGSSTTTHKVLTPSDLQWGAMPPGLPAGAKMSVLNGDPTKTGAFTVRMQAPTGYTILPHTHPTIERVTVISGALKLGMGEKFDEAAMQEIGPGGYAVLPAGMAHFAKSTTDSMIQLDSEGPFQINYVNAADDPRNAKK